MKISSDHNLTEFTVSLTPPWPVSSEVLTTDIASRITNLEPRESFVLILFLSQQRHRTQDGQLQVNSEYMAGTDRQPQCADQKCRTTLDDRYCAKNTHYKVPYIRKQHHREQPSLPQHLHRGAHEALDVERAVPLHPDHPEPATALECHLI